MENDTTALGRAFLITYGHHLSAISLAEDVLRYSEQLASLLIALIPEGAERDAAIEDFKSDTKNMVDDYVARNEAADTVLARLPAEAIPDLVAKYTAEHKSAA